MAIDTTTETESENNSNGAILGLNLVAPSGKQPQAENIVPFDTLDNAFPRPHEYTTQADVDPDPLEIPWWIVWTAVGSAHAMAIAWKLGAPIGMIVLFGLAPFTLVGIGILMVYCAKGLGLWVQNRLIPSPRRRQPRPSARNQINRKM